MKQSPPLQPPDAAECLAACEHIEGLQRAIGAVLLGKQEQVQLALTCLLADGHLLLEDQPGVGKTLLSQALARSLGLQHKRVQFTSDLLPADILGGSILAGETRQWQFQPGPVFTQVLLADEINRATPKTQSALLEAMEERRVTCDGQGHELPTPFFVIATQNPSSQIGTFALPESQLDRFLMRLSLGPPQREAEREMLRGEDRRQVLNSMPAVMQPTALAQLQQLAKRVHVSDGLLDYLQDLLAASREQNLHGLSPRAGLALLAASRAWALGQGRTSVLPEDIQAVAPSVMAHRLAGDRRAAQALIASVPVI